MGDLRLKEKSLLRPEASVISPRPNERLRMISARRAREADLDKTVSLGGQAGRNLSALPPTFQPRSRAVNSGACVLLSQGRPVESAACKARRFRGTETSSLCGGNRK